MLKHTTIVISVISFQVTGYSPTRPCVSFAHFNFDKSLLDIIKKSEFTTPTSIQSQAIPTALSGRDIIGVAKTGSGKTAAYLWPMLVHCMDQDELPEGEGPIGLICSPTRELCQQVSGCGLEGVTVLVTFWCGSGKQANLIMSNVTPLGLTLE